MKNRCLDPPEWLFYWSKTMGCEKPIFSTKKHNIHFWFIFRVGCVAPKPCILPGFCKISHPPKSSDLASFLAPFWTLKAPKQYILPGFWRILEVFFLNLKTSHDRPRHRPSAPRTPPAPQTGRPFVQKTSISLESGANLWKVEFGTPFRRFYSVNLP